MGMSLGQMSIWLLWMWSSPSMMPQMVPDVLHRGGPQLAGLGVEDLGRSAKGREIHLVGADLHAEKIRIRAVEGERSRHALQGSAHESLGDTNRAGRFVDTRSGAAKILPGSLEIDADSDVFQDVHGGGVNLFDLCWTQDLEVPRFHLASSLLTIEPQVSGGRYPAPPAKAGTGDRSDLLHYRLVTR